MSMIDLKAQFGTRYRVRRDPDAARDHAKADLPWLWQIRSDNGFISLWREDGLAAVAIGRRLSRRLAAMGGIDLDRPIPQQTPKVGWKLLQWGSWELRIGFPTEDLDAVAKLLGVRARKVLTDADRQRLKAMRTPKVDHPQ